MATLYELTAAASELYELLQAEEIDEQTFADTLEGIGAEEKLESYCKIVKQLDEDADMYANEIRRLTERKRTAENSVERMKAAMLDYLKATGTDKAKAGTFTASISTSKAVNIIDAAKIPEKFLKPQEPKIDRIAIKEAINAGETVEGAEILTKEGVRIR